RELSWTYDSVLLSYAPKRVTLQVLIVNHVMENIICHVGDNHHTTAEACLFDTLAAAPDPSAVACVSHAINIILTLCRSRYGQHARPAFANALFALHTAGKWQLVEKLDPLLLAALRPAPKTFPRTKQSSLLPNIPRSQLANAAPLGDFFSPQTSAIVYQGLQYVGKRPRDCNRLDADFAEVENALNLPRPHPNLLPPPQYLWALAIASGMEFLLKFGEWHGDLKPDNIFVGEAGNLVLADRTRNFATIAFASPELLDDQLVTWNEEGQLQYEPREAKRARQYLGLPVQWPLDAKEKSEVYAFGVLLLVLLRNMSPSDVYCKAREAGSQYPDWSVTSEEEASFPKLAEVIKCCIHQNPFERPTFTTILYKLSYDAVL
ncbi:MAG: hypothetical protein Q9213_007404, partial [Squamulea squamosa]